MLSGVYVDLIGKGSKPRRLPASTEMLAAFHNYRDAYALPAKMSRDDLTPMVRNACGRELVSVSDEAASRAIKCLLQLWLSQRRLDNDVDSSAALKYASTHWLRHTMLTTHANAA